MILSMTGYGTGAAQKDDNAVNVEIRTVNHRFLDIHIRIPREYLFLEGEIQQLVRSVLDRGRVEVNAVIQSKETSTFCLNMQMVKGYLEAAAKLKEEYNFADGLDLKTLLSLPGIVQIKETLSDQRSGVLLELMNQSMRAALEGVLQMRHREGQALRYDMLQNLAHLEEHTQRIRQRSASLAGEQLRKLRDRISQLLPQGAYDPQRLAQEAALLADKCDISEEVARLESHLQQCRALIDAEEKAGKKLEFLFQEMQREANTILSKSGNLEISQHVLALKANIEKLREQVQNVE